jgi:hypothetical protein
VGNWLRNFLIADATTQDWNRVIVECCEKMTMQWMVVYIEGGWLGGGPFDPWEGK